MRSMLLALICWSAIPSTHAAADKVVLLLYDSGREFSSGALIDRNFEATVDAAMPGRVTIFREYMDLTRIRPADYEHVLRKFYRDKYSTNKPDLIVTIRGRTLDFLLYPDDPLFDGIPILATAMDERQIKARKLPPHVTGVFLPLKFWPSIELARKLQPDTDHVVLVGGVSPNDRAVEALAREELRPYEMELKISYLIGLPMEDLLQRVGALPPRTVMVYLLVTQDGLGRSFMPDEVLTRISKRANAPMYILSDNNLNQGAVGGDLQSFEASGRDTAKLAVRILQGESAASIPFAASAPRATVVDARELNRWGIPSSRIPPGTIVLNREPTLWEAYRWWIVGGISLIFLQTGLIATLLVHRRLRRLAETNLGISEAQGRAAVLEERNRMARDMHDTLAQGFTGVIVQLEAAQQAVAQGSERDVDGHIQRANALARHSLGEARRSIRALRPKALENTALCLALDEVTKQMTAGTAVRAQFTINGQPRALNPSNEDNLLRIYQEILTNALRHSGAKSIESSLSFDNDVVRLDVRDDGAGFELGRKNDGLGLLGIRERVSQMKGELIVESHAGTGTRVCVALPD